MINKRLLASVHGAASLIKQNVLHQWLGMLCQIGAYAALAGILAQVYTGESVDRMLFVYALLCLAGRFVFHILAAKDGAKTSILVKDQIRSRLLSHMADLPASSLQKFSSSELVQLASEGTEQLETYFANYIPQFFYALAAPVTLFVITLFLDVPAAFVLLLCVPLIPASIVAVQKFAKKLLAKYWGKYTSLGNSFLENLQGLTTLKIYQADQARHERMNEEAEQFRKITMRVLVMQLNSISVMDLVAYGGAAAGMILAALSYQNGSISFFKALLIVLIASEYFLPMRLLGSYFHIAMNGQAAADKMFKLLDEETKSAGDKKAVFENMEANNVSFAYGDKKVLDDVNFNIEKNKFTAFAGPSGAGKSTIANLLLGRIEAQGLLMNGIPFEQLDKDALADNITVLDSNAVLFKGTIRENLQLADSKASDQLLQEKLQEAGLTEFDLDYEIAEGGSNLSGGQRQRLALARALVKQAPVLLLDEATSAVDAESENEIMERIRNLKDVTVVCISHRLANVSKADVIYVMEKGRICESGNHEELLKKKGMYSTLWDKQQSLEQYGGQA
jgi:ATP-binding cassette subfamily C protein